MSLRKRSASDSATMTAKCARTGALDSRLDQEIIGPSALPAPREDFKIGVKLRSRSKAARNDPRCTLPQRELYQKTISELSNGGPTTDEHRFSAYQAVQEFSALHNEDDSGNQAKITFDNSGNGNVRENDSPENVAINMLGTGKCIAAEGRRGDDLVIGQQSDGDEEESEDDDEGDDDENDLYLEDDDDEYDTEDEDCSEFDADFEFKWLERIDVEVTSATKLDERGKPMRVAYCEAKLIRRDQMRHDFYGEMELPSEETSMLAFNLFDRYGRLRSEFINHPVIKGAGIWGQELDHGDILLIETVFVDKFYRRQGLGRRMIESLLALARTKTWSFFAFVWPTFLRLHDLRREWDSLQDDAARQELEDREHDRAIMFYRSFGFRRVGSTIWFAMTSDNDHPSHQLASTEDFNPPKAPSTYLHHLLNPLSQISDPPPSDLDRTLNLEPREYPDFLGALHSCMQEMGSADACWMSKDKDGNTVLHLAASIFNVACVDWILNQDFGHQLVEMRNNRGETCQRNCR